MSFLGLLKMLNSLVFLVVCGSSSLCAMEMGFWLLLFAFSFETMMSYFLCYRLTFLLISADEQKFLIFMKTSLLFFFYAY